MFVAASVGAVGIRKFGPIEIPFQLAIVRFDFYVFTVVPFPPAVVTKGFTTAVNEGVLGVANFSTPAIDLGDVGAARQLLWSSLHGRVVGARIKPNIFAGNGGIVEFTLTLKAHVDGAGVSHPDDTISFTASDCTGSSATAGELAFNAVMLQTLNSP